MVGLSSILTDVREKCRGCSKNILMHHPISICEHCNMPTHSKCANKFLQYDHISEKWACINCISSVPKKYNPFESHLGSSHNLEPIDPSEDFQEISNTLNSCKTYTIHEFNEIRTSSTVPLSNNKITILFNNIDGNASNFDSLCSELSAFHEKISVVALAETNVESCHGPLYQMDGYHSVYQSKIDGKRKGSGLAFYVLKSLEHCMLDQFNQCTENIESLFISITNGSDPEVLTVGVIYRPPSGSLTIFLEEYEKLLHNLPNKNVFITGDFNIDLHKSNDQYENIFYGNGYIPTISIATHEKVGCNATCIDNIFTNSWSLVSHSGVLENRVTDHGLIFCLLELNYKTQGFKEKGMPRYDTCETNINTFMGSMSSKFADPSVFSDYGENSFNEFSTSFAKLIDECFMIPPEIVKSRRNRLTNPWITSGIIASVKNKAVLYDKWKKTISKNIKGGDQSLYLDYKTFRKKLKGLINTAKRLYYGKKFKSCNGDMKKTWRLINELRGKTKQSIKPSFMINGQFVQDRRIIANEFNKYFTSIAKNMNDDLQIELSRSTIPSFEDFMDKSVEGSIYLSDCTTEELMKIISELDSNKSSDLPIPVIKKCSPIISPILVKFLNSFMNQGIFPGLLKVGRITPIFKKGDPQIFGNYRPVSILALFGKIYEKIIFERLYNYLCSKNILYSKQFGFRKNHSTSHAINYSMDKVAKELDEGKHVLGIFIDLSKAFDTIDHTKLLRKLENYGIRGNCYNLIKHYLQDRQQYTYIFSEQSEHEIVIFGVPQGSVLGPLLFLLYINDIVNLSNLGEFILFADDTNIFITGCTKMDAYNKANTLLNDLHRYMNSNQLHVNVGKCAHMYFQPKLGQQESMSAARTRPISVIPSLHLNGRKIPQVRKIKFLGVIIDDKLSWLDHIEHIESKLKSSLALIKRIKKFIPSDQYLSIYHSLFLSHLSYSISSWGGVSKYRLDKIFSIQKRCLRILFGRKTSFDDKEYYETCARVRPYHEHVKLKNFSLEHTKPLFNELKLLTVQNLYIKSVFMELFKMLKFRAPYSLYSIFELRENNKLSRPRYKSTASERNYRFRACQVWNNYIGQVLEDDDLSSNTGYIIPGQKPNSDLWASICFAKNRIKNVLLGAQGTGDPEIWEIGNLN